jgi:hypothetical protein
VLVGKDLAAEESVTNDEGVAAEVVGSNEGEQNGPFHEFPIYLDPTRACRSVVVVVPPNHVTQLREVRDVEEGHHLSKRRRRFARGVELAPGELGDAGCGSDGFKAVLVVAGINDPDELNQERIELQAVVTSVGSDERD